jgi:hypothetical protein
MITNISEPVQEKNVISDILNTFDSINLKEMDSVKLMNRTDTKYIFNTHVFPAVLKKLSRYYRVLEIKGTRICNYETLYYDTENFDLYMKHHNGNLNRYKIRCRKYVESDLYYFEIKFKNNKSRTIKTRIRLDSLDYDLNEKAKEFLAKNTNIRTDNLKPVCWVNYSRITLVSKNMQERLTLDIGLTLKVGETEKKYDLLTIAELKQDKTSNKSPFSKIMGEFKIRKSSLSKYCLGVTQLFPEVKQNNFKPKLLTLNKILNAYA